MSDLKEKIGLSLGRIPSGIFIVTFNNYELNEADGMLMSWIQQCSFEPPMVSVAIKKDRKGLELLREAGHFVVNVMGKQNNAVVGKFYKGGMGAAKFTDLKIRASEFVKAPIIEDAVSYLECNLESIQELPGDHVLLIGEIINGELLNSEGNEPSTHVRKSGYDY